MQYHSKAYESAIMNLFQLIPNEQLEQLRANIGIHPHEIPEVIPILESLIDKYFELWIQKDHSKIIQTWN